MMQAFLISRMKRFILLSIALSTLSCAPKIQLESADLLFVVSGASDLSASSMDNAIVLSTGGEGPSATHVAILEVQGDSTWVIDATPKHGVSRRSLAEFEQENSGERIIVMRMKGLSDKSATVERAKSYVGKSYDYIYSPRNEALYCSELVQNAYLDSAGKPLFKSSPMNFKSPDGSYPDFWLKLFDELGEPIPQGQSGTNPNDMMRAEGLEYVCAID